MAAVLERVGRVVRQSALIACAWLLCQSADGLASHGRVDQYEAWAFISDWNAAGRICDTQWYIDHSLPTTTMTYEVRGGASMTLDQDAILDQMKDCRPDYTFGSISNWNYRVSSKDEHTSVRWLVDGSALRELGYKFVLEVRNLQRELHFKMRNVDSVEYEAVLVRENEREIKIEENNLVIILTP